MAKVSILIPSRNEQFLAKTIDDCFAKATGDVEVIACLDGYWPVPAIPDRKNLILIHKGQPQGMRPAINSAASIAHGKYLMKLDAHCMLDKGFDEKLQKDCDADWIIVPRRYSLEPEEWKLKEDRKYPVDYHYLTYPWMNPNAIGLHGAPWHQRRNERQAILVDDEMSSQGSCWFMHKYYFEKLGLMQTEGYGDFAQEFQELGLKCWLSGGQVKVNKNTWYAHLYKGKKYGRGYGLPADEINRSAAWSLDYWLHNRGGYGRKLEWLIDKFWPVPTWPENWREQCR